MTSNSQVNKKNSLKQAVSIKYTLEKTLLPAATFEEL